MYARFTMCSGPLGYKKLATIQWVGYCCTWLQLMTIAVVRNWIIAQDLWLNYYCAVTILTWQCDGKDTTLECQLVLTLSYVHTCAMAQCPSACVYNPSPPPYAHMNSYSGRKWGHVFTVYSERALPYECILVAWAVYSYAGDYKVILIAHREYGMPIIIPISYHMPRESFASFARFYTFWVACIIIGGTNNNLCRLRVNYTPILSQLSQGKHHFWSRRMMRRVSTTSSQRKHGLYARVKFSKQ